MVRFEEKAGEKQDQLFVKEDPARIYRGLKDLLVEEFDMDRIEEERMEFNVEKPKDRVRLFAFKEKSPHTTLFFYLSFKAKKPRDIYTYDRPDDILKARTRVVAVVQTVFPGGEPISWIPKGEQEFPRKEVGQMGLRGEERTPFQRSKFYEILAGIWYNKFYSKEIERYEEEAEEIMLRIHDLMRQKFGVEKSIGRTDASHYSPPWK